MFVGFRRGLGRSILLGLELLVAADIVRAVATRPALASVTVLAAIVLIRSFLSLALELEVTGRWPWQPRPDVTHVELAVTRRARSPRPLRLS